MQTETKHTATPWKYTMWCANSKGIRIGNQNLDAGVGVVAVVPVSGEQYSDIEKANAELIVRAVNTHEPLLMIARKYAKLIDQDSNPGEAEWVWNIIAKAEGE
jgi:hypothetical protein